MTTTNAFEDYYKMCDHIIFLSHDGNFKVQSSYCKYFGANSYSIHLKTHNRIVVYEPSAKYGSRILKNGSFLRITTNSWEDLKCILSLFNSDVKFWRHGFMNFKIEDWPEYYI